MGEQDKPSAGIEGLEDIRAQLDDVDTRIVDALSDRDRIVLEVARRKQDKGAQRVRDPEREESLLTRLVQQGSAAGLDGYYVTRLFREIIDHSVRVQESYLASGGSRAEGDAPLTVAYQGVDGAYSQLAGMRHFGPRAGHVTFRGYPSFKAMMEAVRDGAADYGMLPVENTTAGSINEAYDLLARMDLSVVGEEAHKVEHCLVAIEPISVGRIRRVYSHPQALAQCSDFLSQLDDCHVESFVDTAMAVQKVGQEGDLSQAAIASEEAARRYGLVVIKRGIANQRENYTRFMVVARRAQVPDSRLPSKTSLVLATKHEQGALFECLSVLSRRALNLTKLESRPRPRTPWEYLFYIDFEGSTADPNVRDAVSELRNHTGYLRVLGSYPARTRAGSVDASPMVKAEPLAAQSPPSASPAPGVAMDLDQLPLRLASRRSHPEDTRVELGRAMLGEGPAVVVARSATGRRGEALLSWAKAVAREGVDGLRLSWATDQGAGIEDIVQATGLPLIVDVDHPEQVERAVTRADALVAPAAQMQNVALLRELGLVDRPVWIERSPLASLDEWMAAAEYVLERGNHRVVLVDCGVRSLDQSLKSALDVSAVAALRERCHLPVLVDPTAATGQGRWALGLGMSALWAGAHGVCVAVDPDGTEGASLNLAALRPLLAGRSVRQA